MINVKSLKPRYAQIPKSISCLASPKARSSNSRYVTASILAFRSHDRSIILRGGDMKRLISILLGVIMLLALQPGSTAKGQDSVFLPTIFR
jgi:hypothetical protein